MPIHVINSPYNMPYKAFEYQEVALKDEKGNDYNPGLSSSTIISSINSNPCSSLNSGNKTGWRVPNQKELTILRNAGAISFSGTYVTSCTMSYFDTSGVGSDNPGATHRFMGVRWDATCQLAVDVTDGSVRIHCVRDYIE